MFMMRLGKTREGGPTASFVFRTSLSGVHEVHLLSVSMKIRSGLKKIGQNIKIVNL